MAEETPKAKAEEAKEEKVVASSKIIFEVQRLNDSEFRCKIDGISGGDEVTDSYAKQIAKYMIVFIEKLQQVANDITNEHSGSSENKNSDETANNNQA